METVLFRYELVDFLSIFHLISCYPSIEDHVKEEN